MKNDKIAIEPTAWFASGVLVTFADMTKFTTHLFIYLAFLKRHADKANEVMGIHGAGAMFPNEMKPETDQDLEKVEVECHALGLKESESRIILLRERLKHIGQIQCAALAMSVQDIEFTFMAEIGDRTFAFIPGERVEFFERERLFGDIVFEKFPSARAEIKDAGNCLAAGLNTAAVFHLMRVVELGMRALSAHLGATFHAGVEYADWSEIERGLTDAIKASRPQGKERAEATLFYSELLIEFSAFKGAWRNSVMHTRGHYSEHDAKGVLGHVRSFMQRLATRVSE